MILYHGSDTKVSKPDLNHSRDNVDFGKGFYTTPIKEQAVKWSQRFKRSGGSAVISRYTLDDRALVELKVLNFASYSEEWLDFVVACRRGQDTTDYDIVMGGVANDKVFNTVELYFGGLIEKKEALKRLKYEAPNLQLALRTDRVLEKYLIFEGSETV